MRSCSGRVEELLRRALLDDPAVVHHHDPIGSLAREPHLVGDARSSSSPRARAPPSPSSTSPIISGSSALVGSSNSISAGFIASARAIATRCCWPPESLPGYVSRFSEQPDASQQLVRLVDRLRHFGTPRTCTGASITFSSAVLCGNRLKRWNTMPIWVRCLAIDRSLSSTSLPFALAVADQLAVDLDPPAVDLLEVVDAADERRLARARRADDADGLALRDVERDALQHLEPAEALVRRPRSARPARSRPPPVAHRERVAEPLARASVPPRRRSLAASLRSIRAWTSVQIVVSSRYQTATAAKYSTGLNVCE